MDAVNEAGAAFNVIVQNINALSAKIANSVEATDSSIRFGENVAGTIDTMNQLSETVSDSTETISAATEQQTASMEEIAASSRGMSETATELKDEVDKFRL